MVDCKICENSYCEHAGAQRGIVVECNGYKAPKKPQTNADRIRAMNDEELADALMRFTKGLVETEGRVVTFEEGFREELLHQLQQPVKEDEQ